MIYMEDILLVEEEDLILVQYMKDENKKYNHEIRNEIMKVKNENMKIKNENL